MPEMRIVRVPRDSSLRPIIRTVDDALDNLANDGEISGDTRLTLLARSDDRGRQPFCAALLFRSSSGDDALFPLPISRGCWAKDTLGDRVHLSLADLDDAEVDCDGNATLRDGRHVHAVTFDVTPVHYKLPKLEENIVYLAIRYLEAEAQCLRNDYGFVGIDYATLPRLRVRNVKALTQYIQAEFGKIPRTEGAPPYRPVSITTVQRTLDLVGIQKTRGRRKLRLS
jgi:hypothetical protein